MTSTDRALPDDSGNHAFRTETLRKIALLLSVASTALIPLVYASSSNPMEVWIPIVFAVISWVSLIVLQLGYSRYMAHAMAFAVLIIASFGVYAIGSVRGAAAFLYLGAVAGAGVFLGPRALMASVLFSLTALGGFTVAEMNDLLPQRNLQVGLKVWLTQGATIVVVAVMVYYSRRRARMSLQQQMDELTRRRQSEAELDRSLQRFARIFRSNPSPMLAQSGYDGTILDVNPAFERCYGYTRDEVLGRQEEFLWASQKARSAYLERLRAERLVTQCPALGLRADGSTFDALVSSELGGDSNDRLIITTISDISIQSEAQEKVRRSEERFSKAFHFSPLRMTITRYSDGELIEVNQVATETQPHRHQNEPMIARRYWPSSESLADFVRSLRQQGRLHGYEAQLHTPDGTLVDARIWAELIDLDGEACVLACALNVSEEKRREALLVNMARGMAPQSGESFFMALVKHMANALSADGAFVAEIDPAMQLRTLAVWQDGAPGAGFTRPLASMAAIPPEARLYAESALAGVPTEPDQLPPAWTREQSRTDWPLLDDQGTVIGILSAQWKQPVAITAESRALISIFASRANAELLRHRQEEEVRRLNATLEDRVRIRTAELEQVNAELNSFAYSVSHDLKSPLRAIDGFTHLMRERFEDRSTEQERDVMDRILAATHRMSNLIKDLLALARISQRALNLSEVNLSSMAEDILDQLAENFPKRKRELRIATGLVCRCDRDLAHAALTNLLHNALKYTRDQSHAVIEFGQVPGSSDAVPTFFVRDNGAGFDMVHADKLFKPFQRLHMPSAGFEGTGIGLATVRRIVERHGGTIRGEAVKDQGAVFTFTFGQQQTGMHRAKLKAEMPIE